jgi:L-malate glycosyltransferase
VEIHQILAGAAFGDAITNEALELQALLRDVVPSEVFACHPHPSVSGRIHHLDHYERHVHSRAAHVLLLVHFSIAEPQIVAFLRRRPERAVLRYHNITPPHFFEAYDPVFAALLQQGRVELSSLADRMRLAIADSHYNELELHEHGYRNTAVVPLLTRIAPLTRMHGPAPPWLDLPLPGTAPVVLFVGRIAPNKGHAHLLQAFHVLRTYLEPDARLYFAGGGEVPAYLRDLRRYAQSLGLAPVFTGKIPEEDLAELYRRADVFVSMSEHEGFGAPLVEAMAFDVPVVAWATTAVGETVGDAGVLVAERDPALIAEAVAEVVRNAPLREQLVARGRDRVRHFAPERVSAAVIDHLMAEI